jgi:hypothetical protein
MIQASAPPGLLYVIALTRNKLDCLVEDRHKHELNEEILTEE